MSQPFFLGHEPSLAPVVPDLVAACRALAEAGASKATVSARFGNRFVVNVAGAPLESIGARQFVEVADYDPHQDRVLCIGAETPAPRAGLHALVYRAKKEVLALAQIEVAEDDARLAKLPRADKGRTTLEGALSVLTLLKSADVVAFGPREVLAVGPTPEAARAALARALGA